MKRILFLILMTFAVARGWGQDSTGDKISNAADAVTTGLKNTAHSLRQALTGRDIKVTLSGDRMEMPTTVKAGDLTFVVTNAGVEMREFKISGPGTLKEFTDPLPPGQTRELKVTLDAGAYKVEAPIKDKLTQHLMVDLVVVGD